jgi:3-dehydroquinate dehydratase-2
LKKKRIVIINGPNLNLLGRREPEIYGNTSFENYFEKLKAQFPETDLFYLQSNVEGELINMIQENGFNADGIILNAGGYSHTSVAIADAVASVDSPVVEVHISNIYARESYRQHSITASKCTGSITGLGLKGYELAIRFLLEK